MSAKIDTFIGKLTTEETLECAIAALEQLTQEEAWTLLKDWIRSHDLADEAAVEFTQEEAP